MSKYSIPGILTTLLYWPVLLRAMAKIKKSKTVLITTIFLLFIKFFNIISTNLQGAAKQPKPPRKRTRKNVKQNLEHHVTSAVAQHCVNGFRGDSL